jgi:hypothetical protein
MNWRKQYLKQTLCKIALCNLSNRVLELEFYQKKRVNQKFLSIKSNCGTFHKQKSTPHIQIIQFFRNFQVVQDTSLLKQHRVSYTKSQARGVITSQSNTNRREIIKN